MTKPNVNASVVREYARKELIDVLDSEHGVEKIYHLSAEKPDTDSRSLIYICRPKVALAKLIAGHIHQQLKSNIKVEYSIFFVPRRTLLCEQVLEEEGIYGDCTIGEFHLDLFILEDDLWSLELDNSFRELFLEGDTTSIYYIAKAVMKLQTVFGIIPRILGKGTCAKQLSDLILRMRTELGANLEDGESIDNLFPQISEIDSLIILDRTMDLVTPMCTQLTYEGLIDEVYGIKNTFVDLDASLFAAPGQPTSSANRTKKVPLNGTDVLYSQLRDLNFAVVGSQLNQAARRLQEDIEGRHQARTVAQIKDF
ncbi:hypothetical protein HDV05_005632, partial [Chytridiales sp. JEL 0842]